MKKVYLAFIALFLATPVAAYWQSRGSNYNVAIVSGFTPSCSQSTTALAALVPAGVTLTADKTNYDTTICGLVSDGVWNFDVLYIWAAPTQAAALINLANPGTFNGTTTGSVSFAAYQGFTGDGSTFYLDSGFNPTTATTPNYVQNSATVGVYILTNRSSGVNVWNIGCSVGACTGGPLFFAYAGGNVSITINSATAAATASASSQGAWNGTRTTSIGSAVFLNSGETAVSQTTDISISAANANIIFWGFNTGFGLVTDQMAAGWIGNGVGGVNIGDGVNSCKINNRINTYMANLAAPQNVYSNSAC